MRVGLFCTFENPRHDFRSAYADHIRLVEAAERFGFEQAWIAEHHFNEESCAPSPLTILAHVAARTSTIRLGSAAVLLPFRDPLLVAEDVATLDILSGGRFDFGVAKGGPFPTQNQHFEIDIQESRDKTIEALGFIERLLYEDIVDFDGRFFHASGVRLAPKPIQNPIPVFIASSAAPIVSFAASKGYGLMAGPPFPLKRLREMADIFCEARRGHGAEIVLMRFFHVAASDDQAIKEAREWLQPFIARMKVTTSKLQPEWTPWFDLDRLIEDSLIGTMSSIRQKIARIATEMPIVRLGLKQLTPDIAARETQLQIFAEEIRPGLEVPRQS